MPSSEKRSTDSLLERARRGSKSALNRLMASCQPWLRRKAKAALPKALDPKQDASDVVQDCQLTAAARFREFKGHSLPEFRAWMGKILENLILHQHRFWGQKKRVRKRERPLVLGGAGPNGLAGSTTSVLSRLSQEEERERLMIAASWCREEDWALITRHFLEGRSHKEIADAWNIFSASVRQRSCRTVRNVGDAARLQAALGSAQNSRPAAGCDRHSSIPRCRRRDNRRTPAVVATARRRLARRGQAFDPRVRRGQSMILRRGAATTKQGLCKVGATHQEYRK